MKQITTLLVALLLSLSGYGQVLKGGGSSSNDAAQSAAIMAIQSNTATSTETGNAATVAWVGDSHFVSLPGVSIAQKFQAKTGRNVINFAKGGKRSDEILAQVTSNTALYGASWMIGAGTNDFLQLGYSTGTASTIKANIASAVAAIGHTRYLVMEVLPRYGGTDNNGTGNRTVLDQLNADLKATYGVRFVSTLSALKLAGNGSAPDNADTTAGRVPGSLMFDGDLHRNDAGNEVINTQIVAKLALLTDATVQTKLLNGATIGALLNLNRPTLELNPNNVFRINGLPVLYPDQKRFLASLFVGTIPESLSNTAGGSQGQSNTVFGINSGVLLTTGNGNTFLGTATGYSNTTGSSNTFLGASTGYTNTTGSSNVGVGGALNANTTGGSNTGLGNGALGANTTGGSNVAIGANALQNATASNNVAIGQAAGLNSGSATGSTFIGYHAGLSTTGNNNTLLGSDAGSNITTGTKNLILGQGQLAVSATSANTANVHGGLFCTGCTGTAASPAGLWGIGTNTATSSLQVVGSLATNLTAKTATYTATVSDYTLTGNATSAAFSITLPTAVGITGRMYVIKKTDASANAVTVATTSSQTIDGNTTYPLSAQWKYVTLQSDGSNWLIISNN